MRLHMQLSIVDASSCGPYEVLHQTCLEYVSMKILKKTCHKVLGPHFQDWQSDQMGTTSTSFSPSCCARICDTWQFELSAGSVSFEVPVAVWPMYAEQQMNAFLIVKDLGIAAEIKMDYKNDIMNENDVIVKSNEIEDGIRKLMQPDSEIRRKVGIDHLYLHKAVVTAAAIFCKATYIIYQYQRQNANEVD